MDQRTTRAEAVGELRYGMTLDIGGWGSRRKPMALDGSVPTGNRKARFYGRSAGFAGDPISSSEWCVVRQTRAE